MTREEKAIIYFKDMRKRLCEDYLNICPKDSVAHKATLAEKDFYDTAIQALEQEPCEDVISRKSIKQKLQENHDFFVSAYGGFSNLSQNDKSRVDEIINCIAMVVNEPPVKPQQKTGQGHWVKYGIPRCGEQHYKCTSCEYYINFGQWGELYTKEFKYCPNCGARMESEE